jgi:hypothetical protein
MWERKERRGREFGNEEMIYRGGEWVRIVRERR